MPGSDRGLRVHPGRERPVHRDRAAALNIADGMVIGELPRRRRAIEFRKFLVRIGKAVPANLEVHLVCDNYATHKPPRSGPG